MQELLCAAAGDGVPQGANALLRVVVGARVVGVVVFESEGNVEGPEVFAGPDGRVVEADDAGLGDGGRLGEGEVHAAVADPEDVPVVAVRGEGWGLGGRELVEGRVGKGCGGVGAGDGEGRVHETARTSAERLRQGVGG